MTEKEFNRIAFEYFLTTPPIIYTAAGLPYAPNPGVGDWRYARTPHGGKWQNDVTGDTRTIVCRRTFRSAEMPLDIQVALFENICICNEELKI